MAGLVPAIHVSLAAKEDVDARDERGHDDAADHRVEPGGDEMWYCCA